MGLLDIFTKEKKLKDLRSPAQRDLGEQFLGSLSRGISGFTPGEEFSGNINIGLSVPEQGSLSNLSKFASSSIKDNDAFSAGRSNVLGTLAGNNLDVTKSPQFSAFQAEIERNKQKAIDDARRGAALRGDFRSTGSQRIEGDILTDVANRTNSLLVDLFNQERNRQDLAGQQALQIGQFEQGEPLRVATAQQTLGALPRLVEEANLMRSLSDFNRRRQEQFGALGAAGAASNQGSQRLGQDTIVEPTALGQLLNVAAPVATGIASTGGFGGSSPLSNLFGSFFRGGGATNPGAFTTSNPAFSMGVGFVR